MNDNKLTISSSGDLFRLFRKIAERNWEVTYKAENCLELIANDSLLGFFFFYRCLVNLIHSITVNHPT